MPCDRRSRAARLLDAAITRGHIPVDEIAEQLRASHAVIEQFRRGDADMPLERQLMLALIVRLRVPELRREAAALQGQAIAAIAMRSGQTVCHNQPPDQHRFWA